MIRDIVLTTSQCKRLIGKGLAEWPPVKDRLQSGTIVIAKGTTNRYVAEEILGESLEQYSFAWGLVAPPGNRLREDDLPEIVVVDGERRDIDYEEAVDSLSRGDIYIKGGNALHYPTRTVGILSTSPVGGTIGRALPRIIGSAVRLVTPVGLEKTVSVPIEDLASLMNAPDLRGEKVPTMYPVRGHVFTEIEALEVLTGVKTSHIASGGVLGYEGAVRLAARGNSEEIQRVEKVAESIKSEPPYSFSA